MSVGFQTRRSLVFRLFTVMTVVLRFRRVSVTKFGSASLDYVRPIETSAAFGYLLFCHCPNRDKRGWSSLVENVAPPPAVKAFIEGSSTPTGPGKLSRTTVRRMRIADLRDELTKRQLESTGTKNALELRLIEALEHEGMLSTRLTQRTTQAPNPSCKQELPLPDEPQINSSRTYALRVVAKYASFALGESGAGMLLYDPETSKEVWAARQYFSTRRSQFESAYCAMIMALRYCRELGVRKIVLEVGSDVLVDQLAGKLVVTKMPMKKLYWIAMDILTSMDHFEAKHGPQFTRVKAENLAEKAVATKKSIGLSDDIFDPMLPVPDKDATQSTSGATTSVVVQDSQIDPNQMYLLRVDGGSRNNPGCAGVGMVLYDQNGAEIWCGWKYLGMSISNNMAEYTAMLLGIQCAASLGIRSLRVEADSELVVKQLLGTYQVKSDNLKPVYREVKILMLKFDSIELRHIPRGENTRADELANHAMTEESMYGFDDT